MSYQPYDRKPSGIVFFGTNATDQLFESNSNFTYDGSTLNVPNITVGNGGNIGSVGDPDAIAIASNGDVTFSQDISIAGNLTVNGTTTTVNSTVVTIEDPIIILGSGTPTSDDNKDRGVSFNWYNGSAKTGFFGFDDSSGKFIFVPDATITNEVVSGTSGVIVASLEGNASTATKLLNARNFSLSGEVTASSVSFDGTGNVQLTTVLDDSAITSQPELTSVDGLGDYLLIYDSGVGLKKVTGQNFLDSLNIVTSFNVTDGTTTVAVDQGDSVTFADGVGAEFVVTNVGGQPTVTVNSVDSEIVHDNLSGFVSNEHIDHSTVTLTAGSGLSGGGNLTASRRFDLDISEYSDVAVANGDKFLTLDSDGSTEQLTTTSSLATLFAGNGLTSTNSVINVIGGDGITSNANEIEVTVDNSTIELSASDGSGAVRVKDGGITEAKRSRTVETITSGKIADKDITLVNATSGNINVTLPENGGTVGAGRIMVVKRIDSSGNTVIVQRETADTIDGATNVQLYHIYETMTFVSDGANWFII